MIDYETYRCRIGVYNINCKRDFSIRNRSKRSLRYIGDSCPNIDNIKFYMLYVIFIIYFTALSMSILPSLSNSHSPHANLTFYPRENFLSFQYVILVKLFCSILWCHVLKRCIYNNKILCSTSRHLKSAKFSLNQVFNSYFKIKKRSTKYIVCSIVWIYLFNFLSVSIVNPSLLNPGPDNSLTVFYQNVQGLVPFGDLNNPNPNLNVTKLFELQSYVSRNKPDVVVLNETWLMKSINDNEILPTNYYNIFRRDRSAFSHPPDPMNAKKFRKNGGGVLIAINSDLKLSAKEIKRCGGAEIIAVELVLPNGNKIVICTCYRVGTLEVDNHDKITGFLESICLKKKFSKIFVVGNI